MTTTATDLLERARLTLADLQRSRQPVSMQQWESFDQSIYRLLHELVSARVGWSPADAHTVALHRAFRDYPQPLQPVGDQPDFTPREAARFLGISEAATRKSIRAGALLAAPTDTGYRIPRGELTLNGPVHPSPSDDDHSLARLACIVGALTDLLVLNRMDPAVPELQAASAATIAKECLDVAGAAATQVLSMCDPAIADRPLAIAQYAAPLVQRLPNGTPLSGLQNVAAPSHARELLTDADGLDLAIHQWAQAVRAELCARVPSVEVLRDVNRQGVHLYAALDAVLRATTPTSATSDLREHLRQSALALQGAAQAWSQTTTGAPPSHDYVDASRHLYSSLASITGPAHQASLDAEATYQSLLRGASVLASVTPTATPWASRLLDSNALFVHARHANADARRLAATLGGRMVTATICDVPDLPSALWEAQAAATQVARALPPTVRQKPRTADVVCTADL